MGDAWAKSRALDFSVFFCWSDFQPSGWISIQLPWLDFHPCCVRYYKMKAKSTYIRITTKQWLWRVFQRVFSGPIPFLPLASKQLVNLLKGAGLHFITGNRNLGAHQRHFGLLANQPIGHQMEIVYLLIVWSRILLIIFARFLYPSSVMSLVSYFPLFLFVIFACVFFNTVFTNVPSLAFGFGFSTLLDK